MSDQSSTPPGWYYAEGDPPGTNRFWDGSQWQGGPQPAQAAGPAPQQFGFGQAFTEASQATTALVLSILGIVCCQLLAPVAWYVGQQEVTAIDAGRRDPKNRGTAQAAKIIGIVMTVLTVLFVLIYVIGFAAFAADGDF